MIDKDQPARHLLMAHLIVSILLLTFDLWRCAIEIGVVTVKTTSS
jgi:hypothetical protein